MKAKILRLVLVTTYVLITGVAIYNYNVELDNLRKKNADLRRQLKNFSTSQIDSRHSEQPVKLAEGNEELEDEIENLKQDLAATIKEKKAIEERLNEILKPTREDILSSTIKTTIGKDEVLVTGGYQTADGKLHYTILEPRKVLRKGKARIELESIHYSISPEAMREIGLDSLRTNAGNTIQHGEIWTTEELESFHQNISKLKGVVMRRDPFTVIPGKSARIGIFNIGSDYSLSMAYELDTKVDISEDGSGFDIELRIEQERDSTVQSHQDREENVRILEDTAGPTKR